jgi:hypothetical protein
MLFYYQNIDQVVTHISIFAKVKNNDKNKQNRLDLLPAVLRDAGKNQ